MRLSGAPATSAPKANKVGGGRHWGDMKRSAEMKVKDLEVSQDKSSLSVLYRTTLRIIDQFLSKSKHFQKYSTLTLALLLKSKFIVQSMTSNSGSCFFALFF